MTEWLRGNELERRAGGGRSRRHDAARRLSRRSQARLAASPRIYGETEISERHRHRYEVNTAYRARLEAKGLRLRRHVARRPPARDGRIRRSSLVHRRAVSTPSSNRGRSSRIRCSRASSPRPRRKAGWCRGGFAGRAARPPKRPSPVGAGAVGENWRKQKRTELLFSVFWNRVFSKGCSRIQMLFFRPRIRPR